MSTHIRGYDAWATRGPDYYDGPCAAQSPSGEHACTLGNDHPLAIDHAMQVPVEAWSRVTEDNARHIGARVGDWVTSMADGSETYVTIATWPQRDDDIDEDSGKPTDRKAQWAAEHVDLRRATA